MPARSVSVPGARPTKPTQLGWLSPWAQSISAEYPTANPTDTRRRDRVFTIRRANLFEPHRYRHVVEPIRLKSVEGSTAVVHSHFIVARIMHDGTASLLATGRYLDRIDISTTTYRFMERIMVLDSDKIDTLLAIPL